MPSRKDRAVHPLQYISDWYVVNVPAGTYALEVDVTDGVSTVPQTIDVTITDGAPCVITVNDPAPASKELAKTGRPIASMLAIAVSVISLGFVVLKSKPLGNRS